jgi:mannose-6-phosphate isomerase-like protein (cupin superfamily)
MTPMSRPPVLLAATPGSATCLPWGDRVREVVPARLTAGAFASFAVSASPSTRRPAYVDHAADEAFLVLSGTVTVDVSGREPFADLGAGAAVYVPRGALRSFRTGPEGARLLLTQTPGADLDGVRELFPSPSDGPALEASTRLAAALRSCGIELVPVRDGSPPPMEEIL